MWRAGEAFTLVFTRPEESVEAWHMPGAVNFTFGKEESLDEDRAAEFDRRVNGECPIVTVCAKSISSHTFVEELAAAGYEDVAVSTAGWRPEASSTTWCRSPSIRSNSSRSSAARRAVWTT